MVCRVHLPPVVETLCWWRSETSRAPRLVSIIIYSKMGGKPTQTTHTFFSTKKKKKGQEQDDPTKKRVNVKISIPFSNTASDSK